MKEIPKKRGTRRKYPLPDMEVGDSIFIPLRYDGDEVSRLQQVATNCVRKYRKNNSERKFTVRRAVGGVRVWRTT